MQKQSKFGQILVLVRVPHCKIRDDEAVEWQDGKSAF